MLFRSTQFLLATCARRNEAAQALWAEFDEDLTLWSIPASRMKTGRPHLVPIPPPVRDLLRALPRFSWSDRVFTVDGRRPLGGFSHLKRKIEEALIADGVKLAPTVHRLMKKKTRRTSGWNLTLGALV